MPPCFDARSGWVEISPPASPLPQFPIFLVPLTWLQPTLAFDSPSASLHLIRGSKFLLADRSKCGGSHDVRDIVFGPPIVCSCKELLELVQQDLRVSFALVFNIYTLHGKGLPCCVTFLKLYFLYIASSLFTAQTEISA